MSKSTKSNRPPSSYHHDSASRLNQPTVEMSQHVPDDTKEPKAFTLPHSDGLVSDETAKTDRLQEPRPRLAWDRQGRTSERLEPWEFSGSPLYTREKVNPLTMIEQLRKDDAGVPLNLLDDFNGLPPQAKYEFYQHTGNWQNRLIHGDSSRVMQSLISQEDYAGQVQMIYFDPPYGIGYRSNFMSATHRTDANDVPAGDTMPLKAFKDTYKNGIHSYLDEVHERLVLFKELLKDSGSLFVQIGDENVHLMAVACDEVFGAENRVATITWKPTTGSSSVLLSESASYLLWYAKDKEVLKEQKKYNQLYKKLSRQELIESMSFHAKVELSDGTIRDLTNEERFDPDVQLPTDARIFQMIGIISQGASSTGRTCWVEHDGVKYHPGATRQWRISTPAEQRCSNGDVAHASGESFVWKLGEGKSGMDRLSELGRLHGRGEGSMLMCKAYEHEIPGRKISNVWHEVARPSKNKRYTVQTADKIIERCILMSTDPGDIVLDPTCGSGVTAHMSERWGRRWITIDASRVAVAIARRHLLTSVHPWYRTLDDGSDPASGFIYETFQKVSAATLAYDTVNDPENTIPLVDRPEEDKKRKRLTGSFTVESHNPLVFVPFDTGEDTSKEDLGAATGVEAKTVLDALVGTPISDTNGRPILYVDELQAWPEDRQGLVSHEADCSSPGRENRVTAGVMVAAPDVTVTESQMIAAGRECREAGMDNLIVVAAAFDDNTGGNAEGYFGRVRAHRVVTSRDIHIGGLKDAADAGTFTLLGEPDILCEYDDDGKLRVEVLGYDTYNPATGNLESAHGQDVDCWMIDTDHDGTAFFPRLTYLPAYGRNDPHIKKLVQTLGKDLDVDAHKLLCGLESQPFRPPREGNTVAVKIITRTGAEMTTTVEPV